MKNTNVKVKVVINLVIITCMTTTYKMYIEIFKIGESFAYPMFDL